jgi:hypothetical protein
LLSSLPSTLASQAGNDPIINDYIAFRRDHPGEPVPQSLLDRAAAAMPGVDLKRVGKSFMSDFTGGQSK